MSCTPLSFSQTHTILGTFGISITIDVPEVYSCTNIQLRLRSETETIEDWFDYAILDDTTIIINYTFPPSVCYIDVRLAQCCPEPPPDPDDPDPPPPGGDPPPGSSPDDPPCALIASSDDECSEAVTISNPYRRPSDVLVTTSYNDISIPKKVNLKITQTSCSDISALLCTVRCVEAPEFEGECPCNFIPWTDIYSLPLLNIGRTPYGVPLDVDCLCNYNGGVRLAPEYGLPNYTKIQPYFSAAYGYTAIGFIDGIGYDSTNLNTNSWIKLPEFDNSNQLRIWLRNHFRFFGIKSNKTQIRNVWPYTDLYWHPFDFCIDNTKFTPEEGVAYVKIVPC